MDPHFWWLFILPAPGLAYMIYLMVKRELQGSTPPLTQKATTSSDLDKVKIHRN